MEKATSDDALYRVIETDAGPRILPSELTSGPWNAKHQHGGPVSGLLTRTLESIEAPVPMRLSRMTIEMFRGVPLSPLRLETKLVRAGKRIQGLEARIFAGTEVDEVLVARATGLRVRESDQLPEMESATPRHPAVGEPPTKLSAPRLDFVVPNNPGFIRAVDIEVASADVTGEPSTTWTRLRCDLVAGEPTSPISRLACLCDFASGTGNIMDYSRYTSINPDLSISVLREPRSDWIAIRGTTHRSADGIGISSAEIYDLEGEVARVQASLLLDRRP